MLFGKTFYKISLSVCVVLFLSIGTMGQSQNDRVKLNQLGFYPESHKLAITPVSSATEFFIREAESGNIVYTGTLQSGGTYTFSGETVKIADFSDFTTTGTFVLSVAGGEDSYPFDIKNEVFDALGDGLIKALYFNRASTELSEAHAGVWNRPAGHYDDMVLIHASAQSEGRPTGTPINSPGGWYDAGDYNKYIVPIASSISHMLMAYENFPGYFNSRELNIPESGDAVPDILDEARYALDWVLTMQDPIDGGVYHKLTHANFQGTVMPHHALDPRFVVQKSTSATLDFAAVLAQASRVFAEFDAEFADTALAAAKRAYDWAVANPSVYYNQNEMNAQFNPDINTGGYGDGSFTDEFFWARAELYITTKDENYYPDNGWNGTGNSGWGNVQALGLMSLVNNRKDLTAAGLADTTAMKNALVNVYDWYVNDGQSSPYRSPFGIQSWQFGWGSNGGAGNLGMGIIMAYQLTGNEKYYKGAVDVMDYLMGRNAVGYSYVTGFGDQTPMHIHHRQSEADNVVDPVPGWVAGGANPGNQGEDCSTSMYNSTLPALSFLDAYCSYSTNEITTYWNSPFIYLTAALEALTENVQTSVDYPIWFTKPIQQDMFYTPGDTITLAWMVQGVSNADLYFKEMGDDNFTLIASDFSATDTTSEFVIPNLPGKSLFFKLQDSSDPNTVGYSTIIDIQPAKVLEDIEVTVWNKNGFVPGSITQIAWASLYVDTVNVSYRLTSQNEYTEIASGIANTGKFAGFKVPDALGDSLIIRISDAIADSVYIEWGPTEIVTATAIDSDTEVATDFELMQNYPNPFNPSTRIDFVLPKATSEVRLSVYDMSGREIATLINGALSAGKHSVMFNASQLSSGLYMYTLQANNFTFTRKMTLVK